MTRRVLTRLALRPWTLLVCVLAGLAAGVFAAAVIPTEYTSKEEVYVNGPLVNQLSGDEIDSEAALVRSSLVLTNTAARIGKKVRPSALADEVASTAISGTTVILIHATDPSATRAADIARASARALQMVVAEIQNGTEIKVIQAAKTPSSPDGLALRAGLVIAGMASGILVRVLLVFRQSVRSRRISDFAARLSETTVED
jgi:capsular polysaccharide biosynthesis protein